MSRFEDRWLALREPCDHAARSATLAARFARAVGERPYVIDLGAGTGSNLRYLAPRLPAAQRWLLVDHDPALLGQVGAAPATCQVLNLAKALPEAPARTGIAAAALLDLASAAWLERLARWCRGTPVLMALTVDGRLTWQPEEPEDESVRQRFFADQRTDKGFGPALGPAAAEHFGRCLEAEGFDVAVEAADWRLGPADAALLEAMLAGIIAVQDLAVERWAAARRRQFAAGELHLAVGHVDLLALPA